MANTVNQYTGRTVPGAFDVVGAANASASVTINSTAVDYRRGEYFRKQVTVVNTSVPVWQSVAVVTSGGGSSSGNVFVPKTAETFIYDKVGNLKSDGRWTYTWDAENRLISMVANTAVGPQQTIDYEYDWRGRRIAKQVWNNKTRSGDPAINRRFLYDGWNLIAELDGNNTNALLRSYVWGLDLSGSLQGAGGVGGLLMVKDTTLLTHFAAYDLNGNVAGLVSASYGTNTARYEYGPFGEVIRATGPMAKANPFRWSTKYTDDETDLVMYPARPYSPSAGRWLSRDPIEEFGGRALYVFVGNNPISFTDALGLADTLEPGGNANGSIPANGPGRNFTPDERGAINQLGQNDGCHSCGSKTAGTKTGSFVPDHQPPSALAKPGQQQRLYPHCLPCSQKQGGEVSAALRAQRANAARARGGGAALLILGALSTALDKAIAAQDQKRFDDAYAVCQKKAAEAGLDEGCGCCIVGVILKWSQPAHGPTWLDRLGGRTAGYGPSGTSTLGSVTGTFYNSPCDEVHDPGVWLDWSSTYESHKISF